MVFQPIDQPLYLLAKVVEGTIKGIGPVYVLLPLNGHADPVTSPVLPHLATAVGLVTPHTTRPLFGASAPTPLHSPSCPHGCEGDSFVPWARGEDQRHPLARTFCTDMDVHTEAAWTAPERFSLWAPCRDLAACWCARTMVPSTEWIAQPEITVPQTRLVQAPSNNLAVCKAVRSRGSPAVSPRCAASCGSTCSRLHRRLAPGWRGPPGDGGTRAWRNCITTNGVQFHKLQL
jgi:hypothetical protein